MRNKLAIAAIVALLAVPLYAQTIRPTRVSQLRLTQLTTAQEAGMTLVEGDVWENITIGCIRYRLASSTVCVATVPSSAVLLSPTADQAILDFNLSTPILNEVRVVDENKFTDVAAALANCAGEDCLIFVPPGDRTISTTETINNPAHIILGPGTYTVTGTAQAFNITSNGVVIECTPHQTTFKWDAGATADHIIEIAADVDDVQIRGCDFDANSVGSGIGIGIGAASTVVHDRIVIENNRFTGVPTGLAFPLSRTIINEGRLENSRIANNWFTTTASGVTFHNATNVDIEGNICKDLTEYNCIRYTRTETDTGFVERNISITNNKGSDLWRMGIEVFGGAIAGGQIENLIITGNEFGLWDASSPTANRFCISVTVFVLASIVSNNACRNDAIDLGIGIEVQSTNPIIQGNRIWGFASGITVNNAAGPTRVKISGNIVEQSANCINFTGAPERQIEIVSNTLVDCVDIGIWKSGTGEWSGRISGNMIVRTESFSGDDSRLWHGISLVGNYSDSAAIVSRNYIVQAQSSPTAGFDFIGIRFNTGDAGSYSNLQAVENQIINQSSSQLGTGFFVNSGGIINGAVFSRNYTENLVLVGNTIFQNSDLDGAMLNRDSGSTTPTAPSGYYGIRTPDEEANLRGDINHDGTNVGFFGVTPAARPSTTAEIKAALSSLGLLQDGGVTPLDLDGGLLTAGSVVATAGVIEYTDAPTLAASTTPSVTGGNVFLTASTASITDFTGEQNGQVIILLCGADTTTSLVDSTPLFLAGAFTCSADDTITLISNGTVWYEVSRSAN